ncbi:MAG TPA: hypothetical protein VK760_14555, partial [Candidatus Acidoferrales bacterium]|nr:hypothetical protein [Candidatus Acidoferrales bacterium]
RVNACVRGEDWPYFAGRPMQPVVQLNLLQAPYVPENLRDVALIAVFFDREAMPVDAKNGDGWLLRAYPNLECLQPLSAPSEFEKLRGRPARYALLERDFPDWDDAANLNVSDDLSEGWEDEFGSTEGSKLGGWPTLLQSEVFWAPNNEHYASPQFAFQLARMDKLKTSIPADSFGYFGRGTSGAGGVWTFAWQSS